MEDYRSKKRSRRGKAHEKKEKKEKCCKCYLEKWKILTADRRDEKILFEKGNKLPREYCYMGEFLEARPEAGAHNRRKAGKEGGEGNTPCRKGISDQ